MPSNTRPSLLVGLGGSGKHVLLFTKRALINAYGEVPKNVRLLCFDTVALGVEDRGDRAEDYFTGVSLEPGREYVHISEGVRVQETGAEALKWFPRERFIATFGNLSITEGAAAHRPVGRLALYADLEKRAASQVASAIRNAIQDIVAADREMAQGQRRVQIALVTSLAGGTGAGLMTDMAALLRHLAGQNQTHLSTFLIMPDAFGAWNDDNIEDRQKQARSYAAWREFGRMRLTGMAAAPVEFDFLGHGRFRLREPISDAVYLVGGRRSNGAQLTPVGQPDQHVFPACAHFLYLLIDARTESRPGAQDQRVDSIVQIAENLRSQQNGANEPLFATFGTWVERSVVAQVVRDYARNVNQGWLRAVGAPAQVERKLKDGSAVRLWEWAPDKNQEAPDSPGSAVVSEFLRSQVQQLGETQATVTPFVNTVGGVCYPVDDLARKQLQDSFLGAAWGNEIQDRFVALSGSGQDDIRAFNEASGQNSPDLILQSSRTPGFPKPDQWPYATLPLFEPRLQEVYGGNTLSGGRISPGTYGTHLANVSAEQGKRFRAALHLWLQRHLMGEDAQDFVRARSGKPGYCLDFLRRLGGNLQTFQDYLRETVSKRNLLTPDGRTPAAFAADDLNRAKADMEANCRRGWSAMIGEHVAPLVLFILFAIITILGFAGFPASLLTAFPAYPFVALALCVASLIWLVLSMSPFIPPDQRTQNAYIAAAELYIQRRKEDLLLDAMVSSARAMQETVQSTVASLENWQKAMVGDPDLALRGLLEAIDVDLGVKGLAVGGLRAEAVQNLHISAIDAGALPPGLLNRVLGSVTWTVANDPAHVGLDIGLTLTPLIDGAAVQAMQSGASEQALRANIAALSAFGASTVGVLRDEQRIVPRLMYAHRQSGASLGATLDGKAEPMLGLHGAQKLEQWLSVAPGGSQEGQFIDDAERVLAARPALAASTKVVGSDDPYTLTYLRIDSGFHAEDVAAYPALQNLYSAVARSWSSASDDEFAAKRMHVLPAEQNALQLGLRLARLYGSGAVREFHPLAVACLEDRERATLFLWALLLGYIQEKIENAQEVWELHTPLMGPNGPDTLELPVRTLARCRPGDSRREPYMLFQAWTNFVNSGTNITGIDNEGTPQHDFASVVPYDTLRQVIEYRLRTDAADGLRALVLKTLEPQTGSLGGYRRRASQLRQQAAALPGDQILPYQAAAYDDIAQLSTLLLVDSCALNRIDLGLGDRNLDPVRYEARLRAFTDGQPIPNN